MNLNTQFTLTLAGQGALVDLNKEATDEQKSIYIPDLWDSAKIGDSVYAFPLTKMLARFSSEVFQPQGIEYKTKRTGTSRLIYLKKCDGNDSDDNKSTI